MPLALVVSQGLPGAIGYQSLSCVPPLACRSCGTLAAARLTKATAEAGNPSPASTFSIAQPES
ncbi:hypothetical protein Poly59_22460 [Rubripirellula reticaptiva]|uniref:Uncharacterized protein n=1 Tax=Rubripirellula reticaptiva TaxID=2528013 RepID=A0A5C6F294_9BACT|nr:hypothetical protein Poly59_22460 [Rubripirellula reticaptiva]